MNQKQYHSLEELPLMMNMTDVAVVLGISRAGAYKLAHSADFRRFRSADASLSRGKTSSAGWTGSPQNKNVPERKSTRYFTVFVVVV